MRTMTATALIAATAINIFGLTKTEVLDLSTYEKELAAIQEPTPETSGGDDWGASSITLPDCAEGYSLAEDGSCVPNSFWDDTDYPEDNHEVEGLVVELLPCRTEDPQPGDDSCYWDASTRGNGKGEDFIFWGDDATFFYREAGQ